MGWGMVRTYHVWCRSGGGVEGWWRGWWGVVERVVGMVEGWWKGGGVVERVVEGWEGLEGEHTSDYVTSRNLAKADSKSLQFLLRFQDPVSP